MTHEKKMRDLKKVAEMLCEIREKNNSITFDEAVKVMYEKLKDDNEISEKIKNGVLSQIIDNAIHDFIKYKSKTTIELQYPSHYLFAAKIDGKYCVKFEHFNQLEHSNASKLLDALACVEHFKFTLNHFTGILSIDLKMESGFLVIVAENKAYSFINGDLYPLMKLALGAEEVILEEYGDK